MRSFLHHSGSEREQTAKAIVDDKIDQTKGLFSEQAEDALKKGDTSFLQDLEKISGQHQKENGDPSNIYGGV